MHTHHHTSSHTSYIIYTHITHTHTYVTYVTYTHTSYFTFSLTPDAFPVLKCFISLSSMIPFRHLSTWKQIHRQALADSAPKRITTPFSSLYIHCADNVDVQGYLKAFFEEDEVMCINDRYMDNYSEEPVVIITNLTPATRQSFEQLAGPVMGRHQFDLHRRHQGYTSRPFLVIVATPHAPHCVLFKKTLSGLQTSTQFLYLAQQDGPVTEVSFDNVKAQIDRPDVREMRDKNQCKKAVWLLLKL
jgi:hypothetical protein